MQRSASSSAPSDSPADASTPVPSATSSRLAVAGSIAGIALLAIVSAAPGSPFQPLLPPGNAALGPLRLPATWIGLDSLGRNGLAGVAIVVLALGIGTFLYAVREAWRGGISMRVAFWLGVAFNLLMLAVPLLFSRDVYSYTLYGRIAGTYHSNPYVVLPGRFPSDPIFSLTGPKWRSTPAVYGPMFTMLSSLVTNALHGVLALIFTFKLLAVAASIGTLVVIRRLAEKAWPERAVFAVVLFGWNPVVLFHSVASGHNDLLVALSIAAGLALLYKRHPLWATAALTLGVLVKVSAVIPLFLLIVVAVRFAPPGKRLLTTVKHLAVAGGLWLLFALPFLQLSDPTLGMANLASHEGWLAPSRLFRRTLDSWVSSAAGHTAGALAAGLVRVIFPLVFLVAMFFLVRWVWKQTKGVGALVQGAVWGWALLLLTLTGPVLLPWYIVWTLPLAWVLPAVPRRAAIVLSALLAASEVIAEPANNPALYESALLWVHYVVTIGVFAVLVWLLIDLRRRLASGSGLFADADVPIAPGEQIAAESG